MALAHVNPAANPGTTFLSQRRHRGSHCANARARCRGLLPRSHDWRLPNRRLGRAVPRREHIELMETVSSNLATNLLIAKVDAKRANATAHALGADSILVLRGVEDGKAYRAGLN